MRSPYNLDVEYNCLTCESRSERLFCNMSDAGVKTLDAIKFTTVYPKGSLLFVEGESPRGVFLLCKGKVKLTTSSKNGKTLILKIADPGELLGLSSAILGTPYEVSAETIEPAQVNFIKREDFIAFLNANTEACLRTAEQLSSKYQTAQKEIRSLGLSHSTGEKLAKLLLDWIASGGDKTPKGVRLKVLLTHEEIAQILGTTRETVTRLLSEWKRRKIVEVRGSTVLVLDPRALEKMVTI